MFEFLASLVLNLIIAALQPAPKLPQARRYSLGEIEVPTATEDRALPLGFGPFRVAGNVVWYGDYRAEEVSRRVRTGLFQRSKQTLGYRYSVGLWMTLCAGPVDEITEIWLGERLVWSGSLQLSKTAITTLDINASWTSAEGQEVPEGMQGRLSFFNQSVDPSGAFLPLPNAYIAGQLGETPPAYPGVLHVVWHGPSDGGRGFISTGPQLAPLRITCVRRPDITAALGGAQRDFRVLTFPFAGSVSGGGFTRAQLDAWIAQRAGVEGDANPALAILELLTTRVPGIGPRLNTNALNIESFLRAADRLATESHGIAATWESSRPLGDVCTDICRQINGQLEQNERTGAIQLKLLRQDDTPVASFDDSNVIELQSFSRVSIEEAVNEVHVPFVDRALGWAERVQVAQNAAGARAAGSAIVRQADFFGVSRPGLASILATRELRMLSSPLARARWTGFVDEGVVLKPGDLVILKHSPLGLTLRMRVLSARTGEWTARSRVEIEACEDVFRSGTASQAVVVPPPLPAPAVAPASLINPVLGPAPYALTGTDYDQLLYVAEDPDLTTDSYRLAIQERTIVWSAAVQPEYSSDIQEPAIAASLIAWQAGGTAQPSGTAGGTGTPIVSVPSPGLPSTVASPDLLLRCTPAALAQWRRTSRGQLYIIAGQEWMMCSSWFVDGSTLVAQNVQRAIFDTVPQTFSQNERFLILLGFSLDQAPLKTFVASGIELAGLDAAAVRAETLGPSGRTEANANAASGAAWSYSTSGSRAPRPLLPGSVRLAGTLGHCGTLERVPSGALISRASTAQLTLSHRNRLGRQPGPYFTAAHDPEPGVSVRYAVDCETSPGVWSQGGFTTLAAGVQSATVDLSPVLAVPGTPRFRLRILTVRNAANGNECVSQVMYVYWRFAN